MTAVEREEKVDRLLHDAEHALSGRAMARMMNDGASAKELGIKAQQLIAAAEALDPDRECIAWEEADLKEPKFT